tara:strand:- start:137 stop:406 length:270 start_codon:yes stop_codon:yes gene_type:complete
MTLLVIGICLFLLLAVIIISAKPISMGIEARRNINQATTNNETIEENEITSENLNNTVISDEIEKLKKLKIEGTISNEEFEKAKKKLLD